MCKALNKTLIIMVEEDNNNQMDNQNNDNNDNNNNEMAVLRGRKKKFANYSMWGNEMVGGDRSKGRTWGCTS